MDFAAVNKLVIKEGNVRRISRNWEILFKNYRKFPHTFSDLDAAALPTHVSDGTNYHKVFDGSELMLKEIVGKTVASDSVLYSVELDGVRVKDADGAETWRIEFPAKQTLAGVGTVGDKISVVAKENGLFDVVKTTTMASVDLGSLTWHRESTHYYSDKVSPAPLGADWYGVARAYCTDYPVESVNYVNKEYRGFAVSDNTRIYLYDEVLSDKTLTQIKQYLTGVIVTCEVAEPVTTVLMSDLTEDQVATLTESGGSIEIIGNGNKGFVKPNVSVRMDAEKIIE